MFRRISNVFIIASSVSFCFAGDIYDKYLIENNQFDTIYKYVNYQKIVESLPDYKDASNKYKLYTEDQQKQFVEKANKIQKDFEDLESKWADKKSEMLKIKNHEEYEDEYRTEEESYLNKKRVLEEKYKLLMGEQNTIEADARVKYKELFNPVEKKTVKLVDEFAKTLGEKISAFNSKHNRKPVKIICINSNVVINSDSYIKSVEEHTKEKINITDDVLKYIKSKNISINSSDDVSNSLKNNKNTKNK